MVASAAEPVTSSPRSYILSGWVIIWHKHFIGTAEAIFEYLRLCLSHFNTESITCCRLSTVLRRISIALIVNLLLLWWLLNRLSIIIELSWLLLHILCRDLTDAKLRLIHVRTFVLKLVIKGFILRSNERGVASFWNFSLHWACHTCV